MKTWLWAGFLVTTLAFPWATSAEVRSVRETSDRGSKTWQETITVKNDGGESVQTSQTPGAVRVARMDSKGLLVGLSVTRMDLTFSAERRGTVVSYTLNHGGKTTTGTVNLGNKGWFAHAEQAAQYLLQTGGDRLEMTIIPEDNPGMNLTFDLKKAGEMTYSGKKTLVFESCAQGLLAAILPKLKIWLSPDGSLVAQETLPRPEGGKRPDSMKPVLQEVVEVVP